MEPDRDLNVIIVNLHKDGLSIIETIKYLRDNCELSLVRAKKLVSMHPLWRQTVVNYEAFLDDLERDFTEPDPQP